MGVGRIFSWGEQQVFFPHFFPGGAKSGEIWFLPLEIEKQPFLPKNSKSRGGLVLPLIPLPTPMLQR